VAVDILLSAQASQVRNGIQHKDSEDDLHSKGRKGHKDGLYQKFKADSEIRV